MKAKKLLKDLKELKNKNKALWLPVTQGFEGTSLIGLSRARSLEYIPSQKRYIFTCQSEFKKGVKYTIKDCIGDLQMILDKSGINPTINTEIVRKCSGLPNGKLYQHEPVQVLNTEEDRIGRVILDHR